MEMPARLERERDDVDVFVGEETANPGERAGAVGKSEGELCADHRRCEEKILLASPI